jgi:spore coat protein A
MASRRTFLKASAAFSVAALAPRFLWAFAQSPRGLTKFRAPLRGLDLGQSPGNIAVASPVSSTASLDHYELNVVESRFQFHPELPSSKVWGYHPVNFPNPPSYLNGVIVAKQGRAVTVTYNNKLPNRHPLPIDESIPGAEHPSKNRVCPHLHGGKVDWTADGGPFAWFDPNGNFGASVADLVKRGAGSIELYYPNQAGARTLWYHDHALGITRQNVYAGIASAYMLQDDIELALIARQILPPFPTQDITLVIQDKAFLDFDPQSTDPTAANYYPVPGAKRGDLFYPFKYETTAAPAGVCTPNAIGRWSYGPCDSPPAQSVKPLPRVSAVPEFFADTPVINGVAYPYLEVEPRHYRLRFLNGSQARFYNLQLYAVGNRADGAPGTEVKLIAKTAGDGSTIWVPDLSNPTLQSAGPRMIQIATESGFLPFPVVFNDPPLPIDFSINPNTAVTNASQYNLLVATGERVEVIVDFSKFAGKTLILYNDAPAPFPGGDPLNDYFVEADDLTAIGGVKPPLPGRGPNTRTLMQIRVAKATATGAPDPKSLGLLEREALSVRNEDVTWATTSQYLPAMPPLPKLSSLKVRNLTLNESYDQYGRLIQMLGTDQVYTLNNQGLDDFGRPYEAMPTEIVKAGTTEIWRIFNLTGDTHPMHFHLVDVRPLSRRPFVPTIVNGKLVPNFTDPPRRPDRNEFGYKDEVRMHPGEMTEILVTFELPTVPYKVPFSPRLATQYRITGYEYVWHCHILEHEEHDMMRPLVVVP